MDKGALVKIGRHINVYEHFIDYKHPLGTYIVLAIHKKFRTWVNDQGEEQKVYRCKIDSNTHNFVWVLSNDLVKNDQINEKTTI